MPTTRNLFPAISGLVLIIAILFIAIALPCPTNTQYIIFRIVLSIALAAFAVVIPGIFKLTISTGLKAGGCLAIFAFAFKYTPQVLNTSDKCVAFFVYSISLRDSADDIPIKNSGFLTMISDNYQQKIKIDEAGNVNFLKIPPVLKESHINLQLDAEGWRFENKKKIISIHLINNSAVLTIQRDNSLCCITGSVRDSSTGIYLPDVKVRIGDISSTSDQNGRFKLEIPAADQQEEYRLICEKDHYTLREEMVYPRSKQEPIIMLDRDRK